MQKSSTSNLQTFKLPHNPRANKNLRDLEMDGN